jgi:small GTP-binding protein
LYNVRQERFRSIASQYYRGATGCVLCYDTTRLETLYSLDKWLMDVRINSLPQIPVVLVGNKCDLVDQRQVKEHDGQDFKEKNGLCGFYEASAESGENIQKVFTTLIESMMAICTSVKEPEIEEEKKTIVDPPPKPTGNSCVC